MKTLTSVVPSAQTQSNASPVIARWVEPIPDLLALPEESHAEPAERAILKESIRLALVAALQYLLTQLLSFSACEAAH